MGEPATSDADHDQATYQRYVQPFGLYSAVWPTNAQPSSPI